MRLVSLAAAAALFATTSALAQPPIGASGGSSPVATQTLNPGETLLELSATGIGQAVPDTVRVSVNVRAEAETEAAARAQRDAILVRVRQAIRAAGVAEADIRDANIGGLEVFDVEEPPPPEAPPIEVPTGSSAGMAMPPVIRVQLEPPRGPQTAYRTLNVTLRSPGRLEALRTAVQQAGGVIFDRPNYSVSNDGAASRVARAEALAKARADAEEYAAALGMRVVRIARITERAGIDFMSMMFGAMTGGGPESMRERFEPADGRVPIPVFVGVDFILAPR